MHLQCQVAATHLTEQWPVKGFERPKKKKNECTVVDTVSRKSSVLSCHLPYTASIQLAVSNSLDPANLGWIDTFTGAWHGKVCNPYMVRDVPPRAWHKSISIILRLNAICESDHELKTHQPPPSKPSIKNLLQTRPPFSPEEGPSV